MVGHEHDEIMRHRAPTPRRRGDERQRAGRIGQRLGEMLGSRQERPGSAPTGIPRRIGDIDSLTGEVGTGKTTLINYLLDWLRTRNMPTAFIFNSHLSVKHLFDFILTDFGIPCHVDLKSNMLLLLTKWLVERYRAGDTPVLIIDEAQGMSPELLEEIRLLLNLETASEKLLQVILVGQPELEITLKRPELRQLRQRIAFRCKTAPLSLPETNRYIANRLRIAGASGHPIFAPSAVSAVHFHSRGIPRVINHLCEHSLINAYIEQCNPVQPLMVEQAARDFLLEDYRPGALPSLRDASNNGDLAIQQPIRAAEPVRPTTPEVAMNLRALEPTSPVAPAALPVQEAARANANSFIASVSAYSEITLFANGSNPSAPPIHSNSVPQVVELKLHQPPPKVEPIAQHGDSPAQFIAELRRILETDSSSVPIHVVPAKGVILAKVETESTVLANGHSPTTPKLRPITLESVNKLPSHPSEFPFYPVLVAWKSRIHRNGAALFSGVSSERRTRMFAAVVRWMRSPIGSPQLWKWWALEFKRDWNSMINSMMFPETKKLLLRWLREPISSKPIASSKG
jgi:type II secretory pathway predicted ATPase ExeA